MNVLFYTARRTPSSERLKRSIKATEALGTLTDCRNLTEFIDFFRAHDPLPHVVILQVATRQELGTFEVFRLRLEHVFFILVLPDAKEETVTRGHRLRPRFIAYEDSDFSEVVAVLNRLGAKNTNWNSPS
jgi:hypothetical protein